MRRRFHDALAGDVGLTVLLISLVAVLFLIFPFVPLGQPGRLALSIGLTFILVSGSFSLEDRPRLALLTLSLAGVALVTRWLGHLSSSVGLATAFHVSMILFLALLAAGVLAKALRPGPITSRRLQGAVAVYLLLGLIWGFAYSLVELHEPGSFRVAGGLAGAEAEGGAMRELAYFSFVTLTTLGYGDVVPTSPAARTLSLLEAIAGQLFLVILIARLVALQIADLPAGGSSSISGRASAGGRPPGSSTRER